LTLTLKIDRLLTFGVVECNNLTPFLLAYFKRFFTSFLQILTAHCNIKIVVTRRRMYPCPKPTASFEKIDPIEVNKGSKLCYQIDIWRENSRFTRIFRKAPGINLTLIQKSGRRKERGEMNAFQDGLNVHPSLP